MSTFGMNLRVTTDSKQGGRKYMEDILSVKFQKSADGKNIDYTYLGVFDGHGGVEAAQFAKQHLLHEITKQKGFWSENDAQVTKAIREGFLSCHQLMWKNLGSWPKTVLGHPSTSGTTVSVVFIKNGKLYIAHVGDSNVVLGLKNGTDQDTMVGKCVTVEHKPDAPKELKRIELSGGAVVAKAGVQRVVWNRPKKAHQGPIRRSTPIDRIPFLAIARALGDLWSYNSDKDTFVVSPDPDISTYALDLDKHKCIILASDGLWNMVKSQEAANIAKQLDDQSRDPYNGVKPASVLVRYALDKWASRCLRADNTSVIVAYLDPPQPTNLTLSKEPSTASSSTTFKLGSESEESLSDLDTSDEDLDMGYDPDLNDTSHLHMGSPRFTKIMTPTAKPMGVGPFMRGGADNMNIASPLRVIGKHKSNPGSSSLPRVDSTQVLEKLPKYSKQPSSPPRLLRSPNSKDDSVLGVKPSLDEVQGLMFSHKGQKSSPNKHMKSGKPTTDCHNLRTKTSPSKNEFAHSSNHSDSIKRRHNSGGIGNNQNYSTNVGGTSRGNIFNSIAVAQGTARQVGSNLTNGHSSVRGRSFSVGSIHTRTFSSQTHSDHSNCPKQGVCAKSPLKVETVNTTYGKSPTSAMISPIWPNNLDSDLGDNIAEASGRSGSILTNDKAGTSTEVLQENSTSTTSRVLKSARSFLRIFAQGGSQNKAPMTRGGLKRKVSSEGINLNAKKRKLLPKVSKLQTKVLHSARLKRRANRVLNRKS